jgi:hypothetical protein
VKNYHWLDFVLGLFEAYGRGAETVVLTDGAGHLTEGPGFNVFVVKDGVVATPASTNCAPPTRCFSAAPGVAASRSRRSMVFWSAGGREASTARSARNCRPPTGRCTRIRATPRR